MCKHVTNCDEKMGACGERKWRGTPSPCTPWDTNEVRAQIVYEVRLCARWRIRYLRKNDEDKMSKQRLENARDYFENITEAAYKQFMHAEVNFLVVYSMAAGLYHIGEWICFHDQAKVQAKFGNQITSAGELWANVVEPSITDAGFIRDLNNAAKHAKLRFDPNKPKKGDPSTNMHHAANTMISMSGFGDGGYGQGTYGGTADVKMDEGGREVSLEPIATAVFKFWEALINEFYPLPVPAIQVDPTARPSSNS